MHRTLFLMLTAVVALSADTITFSLRVSADQTQSCGAPGYSPCTPVTLDVPQFNPGEWDPDDGPLTLDGLTWTLSGYQQYQGGYNDMAYLGDLTQAFSYQTTAGDQSSLLGLDASSTQTISGTTCEPQCEDISNNAWWTTNLIQSSGTVSDLNSFIGTGMVPIQIDPVFTIGDESGAEVYPGIDEVTDYFTFTATYQASPSDPVDPPDPVPEPRVVWLLLGLLGLCVLWRPGVAPRRSAA